jgi:hypothetical protein
MWVIVLLLAILLILVLISSLPLIISVFITTVPAWGAGLIAGLSVFFGMRQHLFNSLRSPEILTKLVRLDFDGRKLNCSIQDSEVR